MSAATPRPIVTLQEAKERNLARYFTGSPCTYGHVAERYVNNKACAECKKILQREQRRRSRQKPVITSVAGKPVVSLKEAREKGLTRYFTGEPCSKGHLVDRLVN